MFIGAECAALNIDEGDESRSQSSLKQMQQYVHEASPGQFSRAVDDDGNEQQCMKDSTPEATGQGEHFAEFFIEEEQVDGSIVMSDGQQILPEVDEKEATIEVTNHFGSTFEFQIVSDCSKENES